MSGKLHYQENTKKDEEIERDLNLLARDYMRSMSVATTVEQRHYIDSVYKKRSEELKACRRELYKLDSSQKKLADDTEAKVKKEMEEREKYHGIWKSWDDASSSQHYWPGIHGSG